MKRILTLLFVVSVLFAMLLPAYAETDVIESETTETAENATESTEANESETDVAEQGSSVQDRVDTFKALFEDKILPIIAFVMSSVTAIYLLVYPLITKIKNSSSKFSDASEGLKRIVDDNESRLKELTDLVTALQEGIAKYTEDYAEQAAKIKEQIDQALKVVETAQLKNNENTDNAVAEMRNVEVQFQQMKEAQRIAFLNDENLVRKGYAKDIAKVLKGETDGRAKQEANEPQEEISHL